MGAAMELPPTLSGDALFTLVPGETCERNFGVPAAKGTGIHGPAVQLGEPEYAVLRLDIAWQDDLGERGTIGAEFWTLAVFDCEARRFQDEAAARGEWRKLGGQDLAAISI